jgi:hypothetical protein
LAEPDPVAALAAQVEELRGQLARSQGDIGHLRERLTGEAGQVAMLRLQVKKLTRKLADALESGRLEPVPAPYWADLTQDVFRAQLAGLREWAETFLRPHYPAYMAEIPSCWPNHPEAVWELSTLHAEWQRIYGDEDARELAGALTWHERWLPGALGRLQKAIRCDDFGCQVTRRPAR